MLINNNNENIIEETIRENSQSSSQNLTNNNLDLLNNLNGDENENNNESIVDNSNFPIIQNQSKSVLTKLNTIKSNLKNNSSGLVVVKSSNNSSYNNNNYYNSINNIEYNKYDNVRNNSNKDDNLEIISNNSSNNICNNNILKLNKLQLQSNKETTPNKSNSINGRNSITGISDNNKLSKINIINNKINKSNSSSNKSKNSIYNISKNNSNANKIPKYGNRTIDFYSKINNKDALNINQMIEDHKSEKPIDIKPEINKIKNKIKKLLDSFYTISFMTFLTFIVLIASDVKQAMLPKSVDLGFNILQMFCFVTFLLEIILTFYAVEDYRNSFFFWLDIIATLSIIQDIDWIFLPLINIGVDDEDKVGLGSGAAAALTKAASTSRIPRIIRIVRIVRLIRIVKLYKSALKTRKRLQEHKNKIIEDKLKISKGRSNNNSPFKNRESTAFPYSPNKRHSGNIIGLNTNLENKARKHKFIKQRSILFHKHESGEIMNKFIDKFNNINDENNKNQRLKKGQFTIVQASLKNYNNNNNNVDNSSLESLAHETKISKILSEKMTRKVIMLIIGMIMILPLTSFEFYDDFDTRASYNILTKYMGNSINNINIESILYFDNKTNNRYINLINKDSDEAFQIINITINNNPYYINSNFTNKEFRDNEVKTITYENDKNNNTNNTSITNIVLYYSFYTSTSLEGYLNIIKTFYVCASLVIMAIVLENDTKEFILDPLEIMLEIVEMVSKDPIKAKNVDNLQIGLKSIIMKMDQNENVIPEEKNKRNLTKEEKIRLKEKKKKEHNSAKYEVLMVEQAIMKISALLAIGFGEAGGETIKKNLDSGNELNPMLKGKKIYAIYGFIDIRQFNEVNNSLQEKSLLFCNEIALLVHKSVDKFLGFPNRNMGDIFLVAWKMGMSINKDKIITDTDINNLADCSVLCFLDILKKIHRDKKILNYKKDKCIISNPYLGNKYSVKMGFGLHIGWAIEGAIGSNCKIDASYLSPNVNISSRLNAASRQYGVFLLISGVLYELLSPLLQKYCRIIDIVKVKGSENPIKLYTIDLNFNNLSEPKIRKDRYNHITKKEEIKKIIEKSELVSQIYLAKNSFKEILNTEKSEQFYNCFESGFDYYIEGKWLESNDYLMECLKYDENDGPTKVLINYIKRHNYTSPDNWKGFRELTNK